MHIPAYQIHNVLNTYSLQLFKAGAADRKEGSDTSSGGMSSEARREAVIDKVATEIVQRITRLDKLNVKHVAPSPVPADRTDAQKIEIYNNQFEFQTLDIHNHKTSRAISIEDSIFLIKRDAYTEPA